jgi:putative transposase
VSRHSVLLCASSRHFSRSGVHEHNAHLPHAAFKGQTPDEMYFCTGDKIPGELETARQVARQERVEANRKRTCIACEPMTVCLN